MASYEEALLHAENTEYSSDEDDIYDLGPSEIKPARNVLRLPLFDTDESFRGGAVRSTQEGSPTGQMVYTSPNSSSCSVTVQRLLWTDGWREPDKKEAMTLAVFKLTFKPEEAGVKVAYGSFQLRLKAESKDGQDPRLVAWGPFRRPEMWNCTETHERRNITPSVQLSSGGTGPQISAGIEATKEVAWDRKHTDYGLSCEKCDDKNKKAKYPNCVLWQVFQNKILECGITPEIRVAALFSRSEPMANYLVEVKIRALRAGLNETVHSKVMSPLGYRGDDKVYWKVQPQIGKKDCCYAEGVVIGKEIDLNNMGKLADDTDVTKLEPSWLNRWDRFDLTATESVAATKPAEQVAVSPSVSAEKGLPKKSPENAPEQLLVQIPLQQKKNRRDSCFSGATTPSNTDMAPTNPADFPLLNSDLVKKVIDLSYRLERAESTIQQQNQRVLDLEQTLARVGQTFLQPVLSTQRG